MKPLLLSQGAEALLFKQGNTLLKQRVNKSYRIPELDKKLIKQRTKKESILLEKASKLIPVPKVLSFSQNEITIEFISGKKLSSSLDSLKNAFSVCNQIGKNLAVLHDNSIIHGDLTTSNLILSPDNTLFFIDFGLGFESNKIEDKAIDIHLIKEAFEAKHSENSQKFFSAFIEGYKNSKFSKETLSRLEKVEKRGRYKQAY